MDPEDDDAPVGDPNDQCIELGEEMQIPADWETRGTFKDTEFEVFERNDMSFLHHVNGLFVLYLQKTHPLFSSPLKDSVKLTYTKDVLRSRSITGKKRKGAPRTQPDTVFATLTLSDQTEYPLVAGLKAFVVEVNEQLQEDPRGLLEHSPEAFVAIIQPRSDFSALASFRPEMIVEARAKRLKREEEKRLEKEAEEQEEGDVKRVKRDEQSNDNNDGGNNNNNNNNDNNNANISNDNKTAS
jgi:hypothetical protein